MDKKVKGHRSSPLEAGPGGRPPSSQAGDVERRLLDAARELFLSRGFEGTSCDQVAALARAGKASLYARYANKEALLAAVVAAEVDRKQASADDAALDGPLHQRLRDVGLRLVESALQVDALALMRLVIAEAGRFPHLANQVDAIGRVRETRRVAEAIASGSSDEDRVKRAGPLAEAFIDLVFVPHQFRALLGDDLVALRSIAAAQIDDKLALLQATGWLDAWP